MRAPVTAVVAVLALGSATACSSSDSAAETVTSIVAAQQAEAPLYPDILDAVVTETADGGFSVAATISSPYDSPARYADAFRVVTPDGVELGVRVLTHDHADEQPFTRSLAGVEIPEGVSQVIVEGRDQVSGWGGATVTATVPGR